MRPVFYTFEQERKFFSREYIKRKKWILKYRRFIIIKSKRKAEFTDF